jgi:GNAT superfamily N-acetyltransferase
MITLNKSIALLKNGFYTDIIERKEYKILVSIFKENAYNYIVPKVEQNQIDFKEIENDTVSFKSDGFQFSYYISKELLSSYKTLTSKLSLQYSDLYIYTEKPIKYGTSKYEVVEMKEENFEEFAKSAEICFPGWSNNRDFTKWCMTSEHNKMLGIKLDEKIVSFGAYYSSEDSSLILLMNDGTLPEYRRQGLHQELIKARINRALSKNPSSTFYANVEESGGSHQSYKKLGFSDGPLYFVYA